MKNSIGSILKKARKNSKMTVEEVSIFLSKNGIIVAEKTIYGWENDFSTPRTNTFLLLCKCYGIKDILKTFGYESYVQENSLYFNENEFSSEELNDILRYANFLKSKRNP